MDERGSAAELMTLDELRLVRRLVADRLLAGQPLTAEMLQLDEKAAVAIDRSVYDPFASARP